ncbi:MAG: manganese efflux pump MntP family protein [Hyphomonadaceae bacterium]|nr:manganese efflux pump MntP family protein [Hyphomonadaceae bacterium]
MFAAALALGLALAADAFAVALAQGAAARAHLHVKALIIGLAFGAAQALMPLIGWALGAAFAMWLAGVDHWIAFVVLVVLGLRMLREGLAQRTDEDPPARTLTAASLTWMALATSIDAAAAGLTFEALALDPWFASAVIGGVTALVCAAGVYIGRIAGAALGGTAETIGGVALIAIGFKILFDHGVFAMM